jgi:hypothetical protein
MKRQDILEIIVSNPQAIFLNANAVANKYSEYPSQYQIIGMTADKSYVRVQAIGVVCNDYLKDEKDEWVRDENNNVIKDTRPVAERTVISRGRIQSMPTRLVLKSERTEESIFSDYLAKEIARKAEEDEREARYEKGKETISEIAPLLVAIGFVEKETDVTESYGARWGRVTLELEGDQLARLISLLKSALVEVGV